MDNKFKNLVVVVHNGKAISIYSNYDTKDINVEVLDLDNISSDDIKEFVVTELEKTHISIF